MGSVAGGRLVFVRLTPGDPFFFSRRDPGPEKPKVRVILSLSKRFGCFLGPDSLSSVV